MGSFHNLGASMMQSCLRAPMAPMLPSGDTGQSSIKRGLRHTTPAFEAAQSEAIGVQREGGGYAGVFCNHSLPRCHSRLGPRHSPLCRQTPPDKNRNPVQFIKSPPTLPQLCFTLFFLHTGGYLLWRAAPCTVCRSSMPLDSASLTPGRPDGGTLGSSACWCF